EELARERGGALAGASDLFHVLAQLHVERARREEVAVAEDRRQDVVEVVRDAAREAPDGLHLLRLAELLLEALALRDVHEEADAPHEAVVVVEVRAVVPQMDDDAVGPRHAVLEVIRLSRAALAAGLDQEVGAV